MGKKNKSRDQLLGNNTANYVPLAQTDRYYDSDDDDMRISAANNNDQNNIQLHIDEQDAAMAQQDEALDQLSESIARIKSIASSIGDELDHQKPLLDDLENQVERTQDGLTRMTRRIDKLLNRGGNGGKICIIIVLVIILAFLLFGVVNL